MEVIARMALTSKTKERIAHRKRMKQMRKMTRIAHYALVLALAFLFSVGGISLAQSQVSSVAEFSSQSQSYWDAVSIAYALASGGIAISK